jgi:hypothetical protein
MGHSIAQNIRILDTVTIKSGLLVYSQSGEIKYFNDTTLLSLKKQSLKKAFNSSANTIIEPLDMRMLIQGNPKDLCGGTCECLNDSVEERYNFQLAKTFPQDTSMRYMKIEHMRVVRVHVQTAILSKCIYYKKYGYVKKKYRRKEFSEIFSISLC